MPTYQWARGVRFNVDPQAAGDRIEAIRRKHGGEVRPHHLVADARRGGPLRACFTWDDAEAAREYRLEQARRILRGLVTVVDERRPEPVRAFVAVRSETDHPENEEGDDGRSYVAIAEALDDPAMREQVLNAALSELRSWRQKYKRLQELARLFAAVDTQLDLIER